MTTANHVLLRRITLSASAASVTFDSIPQTGYTDLKIVASARSTANGGQNMNLTFNSTTSGYSDKILSGNGSAASSFSSGNTARGGSCVMPGADFTANTFGNGEIYIPNYTGSAAKSFSSDSVSENNATTSYNQMQATLWNNTAAITSILIDLSGGSFAAGSSFSLYGIANVNTTPALAPKADGGDIIKTDGTYWYHAFLNTSVFKPQMNLTCDILQIAGGGGGGSGGSTWASGGGGGAGGLLNFTAQQLTNVGYTVTVGAGGPGGLNYVTVGTQGGSSQFAELTASIGGGYGGGWVNGTGSSGGSGGGGGGYSNVSQAGGSGTSGQGFAGGSGTSAANEDGAGAGGGGATSAGQNSLVRGSGYGGNGGAGSSAYSALLSAIGYTLSQVAGGGGGGSGVSGKYGVATGGGGNGGNGNVSGSSATMGTGGGGGGAGAAGSGGGTNGGAGGSGVVIIKYPV